MPIIDEVGRKSWPIRIITLFMYLVLAVLGVAMVYPFCMTLTASFSNAMDYNRFAAAPRSFHSREERFTRGLVQYYPNDMRNGLKQLALSFDNVPATWATWQAIGETPTDIDKFAQHYLALEKDPQRWAHVQAMAADYTAFADQYRLDDSLCSFNGQHVAGFFQNIYMERAKAHPVAGKSEEKNALDMVSRNWEVPYDSFYSLAMGRENQLQLDQQLFKPYADKRAADYQLLWQAYRERQFMPGGISSKWLKFAKAQGITDVPFPVTNTASPAAQKAWAQFTQQIIPASETRPFMAKYAWLMFLSSSDERTALGLSDGADLTIAEFNKAFGTKYATLKETPFPVPGATASAKLKQAYTDFLQNGCPMRLIEVKVTPAMSATFRSFLHERFKGDIKQCNDLIGTDYASWNDVVLPRTMPVQSDQQSGIWMEFVGKQPVSTKILHTAEDEYQQFLLKKYGTLQAVNAKYGWQLKNIDQAEMPFDMAYLVTFHNNEGPIFRSSLGQNFGFVCDYLLLRGRAVINTVILIVLTLLASLTVNPLAAYALSRFQMRQMPAIILFMLATMAFPAAVSMIPNYLLMRDLHMLNTYAALILPGVANGMGIFLLKGFFDSLPRELYEAASIDGAKEWQMFTRITIPLSMPIIAVNMLNAFIAAYNSWEWAIVVCQKSSMWTLAVWIYQFNTQYASTMPWAVMAAFVVASLPTFLVFMLCQNIILRGIILPQMK